MSDILNFKPRIISPETDPELCAELEKTSKRLEQERRECEKHGHREIMIYPDGDVDCHRCQQFLGQLASRQEYIDWFEREGGEDDFPETVH